MTPIRVALLDHTGGEHARDLAAALRDAGHQPDVIAPPPVAPVETLLRKRGFTRPLSVVPRTAAALWRGGYDVAHAFTALDAVVALAWRRMASGPVVFTCTETLDRATVADARLRLWSLERATEESDALLAASEPVRAAMARWLALDVPAVDARDAARHERLYRDLLG